ncbi:hypothetical protein AMTR_s00086p00172110 [Amborella trichopoda]|uniref:Uncharacterized protein n=1 Tax=Amborella trichopoda TaxID=13333 RepID=W1P4L0_AMBTC|nr:hypothetical protein AMTR_s00086p00172110 [Amborella trichopoda]
MYSCIRVPSSLGSFPTSSSDVGGLALDLASATTSTMGQKYGDIAIINGMVRARVGAGVRIRVDIRLRVRVEIGLVGSSGRPMAVGRDEKDYLSNRGSGGTICSRT